MRKKVDEAGVEWGVPHWELFFDTPAVCVRVANKGVAGYGEWKIL
jgi:hypothetical protein